MVEHCRGLQRGFRYCRYQERKATYIGVYMVEQCRGLQRVSSTVAIKSMYGPVVSYAAVQVSSLFRYLASGVTNVVAF